MEEKKLTVWQRVLWPLTSRKAQVALGTLIAAFAAAWGLQLDPVTIAGICGIGVAWIGGIAYEDGKEKSAPQFEELKSAPQFEELEEARTSEPRFDSTGATSG